MPEVRLIDANALFNYLKESEKAAREWREETQDEEIKIRAEQAYGTFVECALRVKNAPTIEAEPVRHANARMKLSRDALSMDLTSVTLIARYIERILKQAATSTV